MKNSKTQNSKTGSPLDIDVAPVSMPKSSWELLEEEAPGKLSKEELLDTDLEKALQPRDRLFESELEYSGYRSIQDYDNDAYSANVEGLDTSKRPLHIVDREETLAAGEESPVDPQEHHKNIG